MNDNIKEYNGAQVVIEACLDPEVINGGLECLPQIQRQAEERKQKAWKGVIYDAIIAFTTDPTGIGAEELGNFLHQELGMADAYSGICGNPDPNAVRAFEGLATGIACDYVQASNAEDELEAVFGDLRSNAAINQKLNRTAEKAEKEADRMLVCWLQAIEAGCDPDSTPLSNLASLLKKRCGHY